MRGIPSIEQLRQRPAVRALETRYGREPVVDALRAEAAALRAAARDGGRLPIDPALAIEQNLPARLTAATAPSLVPLINATGVVLHTNLGRAPLCGAAIARIAAVAEGYSNLEYDLEAGTRGRRDVHAERLLCRLTGAAAAVVVNNNAAATMLVLAALARGREVVISRGELVEIGGGFRVPDVMAQSGAVLREVGTTNRTRLADYAAAVGERTALILRVHPSNFRIEGFTERPRLEQLVALGRRLGVPIAEDLGSGLLDRPADSSLAAALRNEPTVRSSVEAGADLVSFSGDKLLGGPQAGIIVGTPEAIARVRQHPLMRAVRADKMTYAALEATLEEYGAGRAAQGLPVLRMLSLTADEIAGRAQALAAGLAHSKLAADVIDGTSAVGGGSAPGSALATRLIALSHPLYSAEALLTRLRVLEPPVVARVVDDRVVLDLRTVPPEWDERLIAVFKETFA